MDSAPPNFPNAGSAAVRDRAPVRKISAVLLLVEAAALVAAALYSLLTLNTPATERLASPLAAFFFIFAVGLVLAARSLWNFGRFGVSFSVTWQLFQALVGASLLRGGLLPAGFFALGLALVLFVLLLKPGNKPDREFLVSDPGPPDHLPTR